jgi:Acyclic terpene utilisation family protein AtuA
MLRIGCGAGFSSDRLGPAVDLARDGDLDWLMFETIGERTMAFGHRDRQANPAKGYNPQLAARLRGVLGHCAARAKDGKRSTRIITNMGVANVAAAAEVAISIARALGLKGLRIAAVEGDDVTAIITPDTCLFDAGHQDGNNRTCREVSRPIVGANVYLGIDALLPAIEADADVIIAGRVADPSLVLAPLVHHYGWDRTNWPLLGRGTLVGHLLECGMQITGGYFADPGFKHVPRPADCGFPIAEVDADGSATITKLASAGGVVSVQTVKEQLLYEVHDPTRYLTPDVTADFSGVRLNQTAADRVRIEGASGTQRPNTLKVTVGFDGGLLGEAGISYAGTNARARAELARKILNERLGKLTAPRDGMRVDLIGVDSLYATAGIASAAAEPQDVRVRVAMRCDNRETIETMMWEVESLLCCGPAGGGGYRGQISPSVITHSTLIARASVKPTCRILIA